MKKYLKFLDAAFPFIATLFLWRMAIPVINPNGILAVIPIFYYGIVQNRSGFLPMAILGCFLLDYNFDTMLFWTALFCAFYAGIGLQNFINPATQKFHAISIFMAFAGTGAALLGLWTINYGLWAIIDMLWLFLISVIMYIPLTWLFQKAQAHD